MEVAENIRKTFSKEKDLLYEIRIRGCVQAHSANNLVGFTEKKIQVIRLVDGIDDLKMTHINVILGKLVTVQPASPFHHFCFFLPLRILE